tara:strand:+ start:5803 stop:9981 length:4179 start_codon:yes stop_codon:yes gene_type:complete
MAFQYVLPHAVTSQLDSLRRRIRRVAFLRGCGLFLTLSCGLLIGTLLIDFLFDLQTGPRLAGFVVFCVAEVVLLGFLLVRPLVIRLTDPEVASLVEEKFPELGERVSSLVELADPDVPDAEKGSPLMRDLLEEETLEALARCDFDRSVSVRPAVRRLSYGFGTLSFLVLSLLIFPSVSSLLLARLFNPWGNYESVSRLLFEIEGADEFVARGDDLQIVVKLTWRNGSDDPVPEPVQLSWHSEDGNSDVRTLRFDPDRDAFTTAIPDVQDSLEFFVSSEGNRSRRYRINVLDRPEVLAAKLEISPPGYLGQPRETLDGVTGEIAVFEHSRLTFDLTFSQPVDEAAINWLSAMVLPDSEAAGDQQVVPLNEEDKETADELRKPGTTSNLLVTVDDLPATQLVVAEDGLSARLQIPATIQGAFAFVLKESHGLENDSEPFRQLIIRRDQPPVLEVPGGEQDRAKPTDVYGIRVSAVDDVALEELELHVSSREGLNKVIKAPSELLGRESLEHEFRIDLSDIAVKSGDFLKLQIRAADGRPTPSANEVWSKVRYVAISDDASAQGTNDVLARQEQIRKELQDIRDQLREAVEQSDDLRDDAQRSLDDDRKFAQQQAVENLAGREEELAARMAELANQFSEHPLFANLSENLWRMAADELDPVAVKLAESSQQERKDQVAMLNENSAVADMVEEGLANVAVEFEKLADLEEDLLELNRISQRANQLADDARQLEQLRKEIASKTPDAAEPLDSDAAQRHEEVRQELAENQQLLMEEQSELMAALDHLMQQRPELLEAARDHQLGKLAGLARQASEVARPQELLAESLKKDAELARQTAESIAKPEDQNSEVEPSVEPLTKAGSLPAEQNSTEQNSTGQTPVTEPGNSAADVAVSEENDPVGHPPNSEPVASPQTSPSIGELLAQQEELTAQAARLALQTAREAGTDSPATRSAAESAQQSEQAEAAARGGQFAQAASEAADAQQTAAATAEALQESAPELAEQAQQLAVQQQQMADAFEQLENSPSQRAAAQQEQQRRLAAQADQIAQALDELAEQLGSQPLDLQQQGQQASSAQQSAQQGQQSASQAAQNMQAGRRDQAAQAAQQAADSLRESAQQAAADSPRPNSNSPVPGEFAAQISDAMRQLQNAQERLAQAAAETPQASQTSGEPGETSAEVASGNSEPGTTAIDATTGETATAQPPSGDSPSDGEPTQRPPSQGVPAEQADEAPSPDNAVSDSQPGQQSGQPTPGTPGSKRQPGSSPGNQPGQQTQQRNGALAEAADALQQAAEMLSDAAQQLAADGSQSGDNQGQSNQQPSSQQPGLGNSGTGAFADGEMKGPLDTELKRRAMKNWGQLPGNLKTEILQSSQRKANGDYAKLIKLYFDELAKAGQGDGKK